MSASDNEKSSKEGENDEADASAPGATTFDHCYEICIAAKLDPSWLEWFEGLEMRPWGKDWTMLCGPVPDQAALLGILNKLCRLNLPLVSVNEIKGKERQRDADKEGGDQAAP